VLRSEDLPDLRPDAATTLAVCDATPGLAFVDGGEDLLGCSPGVELGLRAIQTVTEGRFDRVWLHRAVCDAAPCSEQQLGTGTLTAWVGHLVWTTDVDGRSETATLPTTTGEVVWPSLAAGVPAIQRPRVAEASAEVNRRAPLPFCGSAEMGEPPTVDRCFLAAVFAGRPAEMIETLYGTEGGTIHRVTRFTGTGAIATFQNSVDAQAQPLPWFHHLNRVSLGVTPEHWTAEPIDGTYRPLR
jgi:hypothetical protein